MAGGGRVVTSLGVLSRGRLISRVDNHIIWLEPFLKYNMGPFSWLYERMRPVNGKLFGIAGQPPAQSSNYLVLRFICDPDQPLGVLCSQPWQSQLALDKNSRHL